MDRDALAVAIAGLDAPSALALVRKRLDDGGDPLAILNACRDGMMLVGERFQKGEYFVSDLLQSGSIFRQAAGILEPRLGAGSGTPRGTVVVGTVKGDLHDLGKNLVVMMLKATNYAVHDLGVNVPPPRFVEALQETRASALGLSGLLTTSFGPMKETVAAVDAAGLRPGVRIMIGGGPTSEQVRAYTGADAWGADAQSAVNLCTQWVEAGRGE